MSAVAPARRRRLAALLAVVAGALLLYSLLRYASSPEATPLPSPDAGAIPKRVASLNLAADEILAEILPPERLAGVTRFVDEKGTSNVVGRVPPDVFRFPKADMEILLSRQPDLVVVSEFSDADFRALVERSGIRVHRMTGLDSLQNVRQAILDLGAAVGERGSAARLVQRFDDTRAALRQRVADAARPRVLYWSGGMTAGTKSSIGALIVEAGGRNVGEELGITGVLPVGAERAYAADPDVILVGNWGGVAGEVRSHPLLKDARAVKAGRIVELPNELLVTLSQFTADAAWRLGALLHPDRVQGDPP